MKFPGCIRPRRWDFHFKFPVSRGPWGAGCMHFYVSRGPWGAGCMHFYASRSPWGAGCMHFYVSRCPWLDRVVQGILLGLPQAKICCPRPSAYPSSHLSSCVVQKIMFWFELSANLLSTSIRLLLFLLCVVALFKESCLGVSTSQTLLSTPIRLPLCSSARLRCLKNNVWV